MKGKAKKLENSVHLLQIRLYNFAEELEDRAAKAKSEQSKYRLLKASQYASNAGFELDISTQELEHIQNI